MVAKNILPPEEAQSQEPGETNYPLGGLKILARIIAHDLLTKRSELAKNDKAKLNIPDTSADSNEDVS